MELNGLNTLKNAAVGLIVDVRNNYIHFIEQLFPASKAGFSSHDSIGASQSIISHDTPVYRLRLLF